MMMLGRKKHLAVVQPDPDAMIDAALEKLGASLAAVEPIIPQPDRPLDTERECVRDRIEARKASRTRLEYEMAALIGEAEQKRELIAQHDTIIAGELSFLATLDKYQPTQMAAE
jgi:hypothetical protein